MFSSQPERYRSCRYSREIGLVGKRLDICLARERLESGLVRGLVRNLKGVFRADIPGMLFKLAVDIRVHEQIPYL
jgi:hypothetical protein